MRWRAMVPIAAVAAAVSCGENAKLPTAQSGPPAPNAVVVADVSGNPYEQCRNGDDGVSTCSYVTGSINNTNSTYTEGDVVPLKLLFNDLVSSGDGKYSVTITFEHFKSSSSAYAYDFPATYDATEADAQSNPCVSGASSSLCPLSSPTTAAFSMTAIGGERAAAFALLPAAQRNLTAWGVNFLAVGDVEAVDAQTSRFTITFGVDQSKAQADRDVVLAWGGHLARDGDYAGADNGAADISGAPFHWGLESDGSRDLPMQPGAVVEPGTVSGIKFHDRNADGIQQPDGADANPLTLADNEEPLSGWTISAAGGPSAGTSDVTNSAGYYSLSLLPGSYTISESCAGQTGWIQSKPASAPAGSCGNGTYSVTVTEGGTYADRDFGNYQNATKSGTKYNDVNGNGIVDGTDAFLTGYTMYIDANNDGVLGLGEITAPTDANGVYQFTGLTPGVQYVIREDQHANWTCTYPATVDVYGCKWVVTLSSGQVETNNNFLNTQPASGCTSTIGFWKTHTGLRAASGLRDAYQNSWFPIWLGTVGGLRSVQVPDRATAAFYLAKSGDASNGVNKLYAQLLGTKLNVLAGANPTTVAAYITEADGLLAQYNAASWTSSFAKSVAGKRIVQLASIFDQYNNGILSGAPRHCN